VARFTSGLLLFLGLGCAGAGSEGREAGDCSDDADNDGDGLFDCDDDSCAGSDLCDGATDDTCAGITPTGTGTGDIPPELTGTDQDGHPFRLYDHCEDVVLVLSDTSWEGVGVAAPLEAEDLWDDYRSEGLTVVVALGEGITYEPADESDVQDYAEERPITFPVVADPDFAWSASLDGFDGGFPFVLYLEPGLIIAKTDTEIDDAWVEENLP
jgi:hypothetical protein